MRDWEGKWTSAYLVITEREKLAYFLIEYNGCIQSRLDNNILVCFFFHLILLLS